jgi:iron uptake system EfeUOB component EfeO/EfeM
MAKSKKDSHSEEVAKWKYKGFRKKYKKIGPMAELNEKISKSDPDVRAFLNAMKAENLKIWIKFYSIKRKIVNILNDF